jgi:hypothetical protein
LGGQIEKSLIEKIFSFSSLNSVCFMKFFQNFWFQLVPAGSSRFQPVPAGSSQFQPVPASSSRFQPEAARLEPKKPRLTLLLIRIKTRPLLADSYLIHFLAPVPFLSSAWLPLVD